MTLKLEIRRNADGEMATDIWKDWEWNEYWWKEGNASCDCNRDIFFLSARKEEDTKENECGNVKYSVRCSDNDTGEVLYSEF